jgi:hypothetical protein
MGDAVIMASVGVATGGQIVSAEKSRKAQKQASKVKERQSRLASARDSMAQVRQARIAQAQIIQGASTQGTTSSSGAQGGYSAVGSLTSGNQQFLNQMDSMNSQISGLMRTSQRYEAQANNYKAVSDLAMSGTSFVGTSSGGTAI